MQYTKVLELINKAREHMGLSALEMLPRGSPCDSQECPLSLALPGVRFYEKFARCRRRTVAEALSAAWSEPICDMLNGWLEVNLPQDLKNFVTGFDNGAYPDLVL